MNSKKILYSVVLLTLTLLIPVSVFGQTTTNEDSNVSVSKEFGTHGLVLKATQDDNDKITYVKGFAIKPENVVQIRQGDNLMINTANNEEIEKVKVTDVNGLTTQLISSSQQQPTTITVTTSKRLLNSRT